MLSPKGRILFGNEMKVGKKWQTIMLNALSIVLFASFGMTPLGALSSH